MCFTSTYRNGFFDPLEMITQEGYPFTCFLMFLQPKYPDTSQEPVSVFTK